MKDKKTKICQNCTEGKVKVNIDGEWQYDICPICHGDIEYLIGGEEG